jgi:2-polyprenyl-6-methoxyphenol hydroxylase-like FAD-dependent oxidoreductase
MPDPIFTSIATAVAAKSAEVAVQGGKDACAALIRLIRERFRHDKDAAEALESAQRSHDDKAAVAGLAQALERLVSADADFASRVRDLWPRVAAELSASKGGVVNSATGFVGGHLMQARDVQVEGGLHFGDVRRPDEL